MKRKTFFCLWLSVLTFFVAGVCWAEMEIHSIEVNTLGDSAIATINGSLTTSCDYIFYDTTVIDDELENHIAIHLNHIIDSVVCFQIITDFSKEVSLGELDEGSYVLFLNITHYDLRFSPPRIYTSSYVQPFTVSSTDVDVEEANETISIFTLSQNYPNPFNPETKISYQLPCDCHVNLTIYNIQGEKVKTLIDKHQTAGHKTVHWDGKDERGKEVASGTYFYKLNAGSYTDIKKMILLK